MATAEEGMAMLGGLCAQLDEQLQVLAPNLNFTGIFWTKGKHEDPLSVAIFSRPEIQPEAPYAAVTAARATQAAASGLELHGLDTPDRVCFYEQEFYVLSNFSAFSIYHAGRLFPTVEHAYHWEKFRAQAQHGGVGLPIIKPITDRLRAAEDVHAARSAHEAFKIAQERKALRRTDWDDVKLGIMQELLREKAEQHEYVRRKLLATGHRYLVENSWRDNYWGWGPNRDGKNMLGKLWMGVRAELRGEPLTPMDAGA